MGMVKSELGTHTQESESESVEGDALSDLEMSLDWMEDLTQPEKDIPAEIYRLAQEGGESALEAAKFLDSTLNMDTSLVEFWLGLKLLLASGREACSYSVLKYVLEKQQKDAQFAVEFVEVGLGRDVCDLLCLEQSSLYLSRTASALLNVLANALWSTEGCGPKSVDKGSPKEEEWTEILEEFYGSLKDTTPVAADEKVQQEFQSAVQAVRQHLVK